MSERCPLVGRWPDFPGPRPTEARTMPTSTNIWPNFNQIPAGQSERWAGCAQMLALPGRCFYRGWPIFDQIRPMFCESSANHSQICADFAQTWPCRPTFGRSWPIFEPFRPIPIPTRTDLGRLWPMSTTGPLSVEFGRSSTNWWAMLAKFGLRLTEFWATLANRGPFSADLSDRVVFDPECGRMTGAEG